MVLARFRWVFVSLLLLISHLHLSPDQSPAAQHQPTRRVKPVFPTSVADILWWLPPNTETVIVARGPFKLPVLPEEPNRQYDKILQLMTLGALTGLKEGSFYQRLVGRTVSLAVEGSRRFREPSGLGEMPYEGCAIILFQVDLGLTGVALMKALEAAALRQREVRGHRVMIFEEKMESDTWTILVAHPKPNVLLCATDEGYLSEVLNRMGAREKPRALPETLPEWKHLDVNAPFWALRHYDRENASSDPSSPLTTQKAANVPDDQGVGLVFEYNPSRGKVARVKYLSANKNAVEIATKFRPVQVEKWVPCSPEPMV